MSTSKTVITGSVILVVILTVINVYTAFQISSESSAINSPIQIVSAPSRLTANYNSWQDSGDNPPHCWWYQFLAPIGTFCYQNDPQQPKYRQAFTMDATYYISVNQAPPAPSFPTQNFPPLVGHFPIGSLKEETTTNNSTTIVEGKVAGLVLKDGQLLLTFQDKTTDGISSINIDASKVNLTAIHVGSVVKASIVTTTTADVYVAVVPFTLVSINDPQGICQWQTPYGAFAQTQFNPSASTACLRYTNVGGTISSGSTFWTLSTTTKTSVGNFQVISK